MRTIAQKKAQINGWIKEYKKRIEDYKLKYGYESRKFVLYRNNCNWKIKQWHKKLIELNNNKLNKVKIVSFLLIKSELYFVDKLEYHRGQTIDEKPIKSYIAKLVVDLCLCDELTARKLRTTYRKLMERRDNLTKNKEHKDRYRAYRLTMMAELKANNIQYK